MAKRFITPFAEAGDRAAMPDIPVGTNSNYQTGYPSQYEEDPIANPATAKFVERDKTNQLYNDITANIKEWQEHTFPAFITSAVNGGVPFSYKKNSIVTHLNVDYVSNTDGNTDVPPSSKWPTYPEITINAVANIKYSEFIDYEVGVEVRGSDNETYICRTVNGPSSFEVDPVGEVEDRIFWEPLGKLTPRLSVRDRTPTRADNGDITGNNLWRAPDGLYISNRVSPGNWATWFKDRSFNPKIGEDLGAGAPEAIWWLSKVVDNYVGPCINVTNEATTGSTNIGFDSDGNLDVEALDAFLRASRGLINTWYDQRGNGHDLTSAGVNRPVISSVNKVGNLLGIVFETSVIYNGAFIPDQFMTIPNTLTGQSDSVSFASFCSLASTIRDAPIIELTGGDGNFTALGKRDQTGINSMVLYQNSSLRVISDHQPPIKDNFFVASFDATAEYFGSDVVAKSGTVAAGVTWTGGKVGGTTDLFVNGAVEPQNGGAIMAGLAVYLTGINPLVQRNMFKSVTKFNELTPQYRGNLIFDGDSITEGAFATFFDSPPSVVAEGLIYGAKVFQVSKSGGTSVTQEASLGKWDDRVFKATSPYNIVVYAIGTNDIGSGSSAATVYANILSYITDVQTTGYDVILSTVLPRNSFTGNPEEVERLALNELLRDNWESLGVLGLIDYDSEGTMGEVSFVTNAIYYVDGTHPTPLGGALISIFQRETIEAIIARKLKGF